MIVALPLVLFGLFVLLAVDALRWKVLVQRELKRRNLVRVPSRTIMMVDPAAGYQLIDTCTCERDGKVYDVTILNRGWFRARLSVELELWEESGTERRSVSQ
jgi:hypothetical protein